MSYAPTLPLILDESNNFVYNDDFFANVKQKFKMILYTNPGEKIMNPKFGLGIRNYLFNLTSGYVEVDSSNSQEKKLVLKDYENKLFYDLSYQCNNFFNEVKIESVSVSVDEIRLNVSIKYSFKSLFTEEITVSQQI